MLGGNVMKKVAYFCAALLCILTLGNTGSATAADFYAGKTITISSYGGAGNNYDAYARLVGRYLGKYIPGHPSFIIYNQPGAGGLVAANYTSRIAPKDGTFIALFSDGLVMFEATGRTGLQDSLAKYKCAEQFERRHGDMGDVRDQNPRRREEAHRASRRLRRGRDVVHGPGIV
jgi:hypothetical protein